MSDIEDVLMPDVVLRGSKKDKVNTKDDTVFSVEFSKELAKVTKKDESDFKSVVSNKEHVTYDTMTKFFEERSTGKIQFYQDEMEELRKSFDQQRRIQKSNKAEVRACLKAIQRQEVIYQDHIENTLNYISNKELQHVYFRLWRAYINTLKFRRSIIDFCGKFRGGTLKAKVFNSWKHSFMREGIDAKLRREYEKDLNDFKDGYLSIIATLQTSIRNTEEQIKRKSASRKEFSYNLNRNLLKTISNLSMEVVNLNQFAIKDREVSNELNEINFSVKNKLKELEKFKAALKYEEDEGPIEDANIISN